MQLYRTIFLDSSIFIDKKWWRIDGGKTVKNGGEKDTINSLRAGVLVGGRVGGRRHD
jgi:hypothetical protein